MIHSVRCYRILGSVGATLLLGVVGCGSDMVQVGGRVEYEDGSPIVGAIRVIRFEPDDETSAVVRKTASGEIAEDGTFRLMTKLPDDGVFKGEYVVTFTVLKDPKTGESLIKEEFSTFALSPFEVSVQESKSDYLFQLEKM